VASSWFYFFTYCNDAQSH